jgi:sodium transport system ATP-binding protein
VLPERVDEILNVLGLDRIADRPSGGFSQGERIKVALGRVLVHAPRNLLLDEVTNGLDIPTVRGLRTFLRGLRDDGRAIVFSSHVLDEIRALCDRIVVISHGKVVVQGSADEICRLTGAATLEDAFVAVTRGEEMPA